MDHIKSKFKRKKIKLLNGESQKYFLDLDPKAHIAQVREDKEIYVNKDFEKLSRKGKLVSIYHERGHSKFLLFTSLTKIVVPIIFSLAVINVLLFSDMFKDYFFKITILINIIVLLSVFTLICWLQEIISDSNAVKHLDKKIVISTIGNFYENKKFDIINDWIFHPPWKLRKKILEGLD